MNSLNHWTAADGDDKMQKKQGSPEIGPGQLHIIYKEHSRTLPRPEGLKRGVHMIRSLLKPLSFLPAFLMMYMIFSFSAQDGAASSQLSYKISYKVVEIGGELLGADFEPWEIEKLADRFHGAIRKLAHMTEYFALAISVAFPLYVYGLRGILLMLVAGFFCVAFACGDEYHQSFVAGRGPSKRDVLIDSFGVFWGIVVVRIIGWTGRKTIFRPWGRKRRQEPEAAYAAAAPYPPYAGETPPSVYPPGSAPYQPYPYRQPQGSRPYPPQGGPAPYAGQAPYYGAPGQAYPPPYEPYEPYEYEYEPEEEVTSDRLSEDMSFRKLVRDIKSQKKRG